LGYAGVLCFTSEGKLIGRIRLPEVCANLTFGGPKRDRLFMCASQSLYLLQVLIKGRPQDDIAVIGEMKGPVDLHRVFRPGVVCGHQNRWSATKKSQAGPAFPALDQPRRAPD
jgi:hypothetical protein